jgi:hypothetical protein
MYKLFTPEVLWLGVCVFVKLSGPNATIAEIFFAPGSSDPGTSYVSKNVSCLQKARCRNILWSSDSDLKFPEILKQNRSAVKSSTP